MALRQLAYLQPLQSLQEDWLGLSNFALLVYCLANQCMRMVRRLKSPCYLNIIPAVSTICIHQCLVAIGRAN